MLQIKSPLDTNNDFVGTSRVGSFYPGGPDVISLTFTVNDDTDPEMEETFTFELTVFSEGVTVESPRVAAVTIAANDDAYGVFSFGEVYEKQMLFYLWLIVLYFSLIFMYTCVMFLYPRGYSQTDTYIFRGKNVRIDFWFLSGIWKI